MTNADKIRQMTDEELAEEFCSRNICDYVQDNNNDWCERRGSCNGCVLAWLKQEAEG